MSGMPAQKAVRAGGAYLVQFLWDRDEDPNGGRDPETEGGGK